MDLSRLLGNDAMKRQLDLQTERRGLSHAYIISGPKGSGRHTLAKILSAAMVCTNTGKILPCGHCTSCHKSDAGIHPDIMSIGEDGKDINVAKVREMRADAYIRPNEASRKVYILSNAQTMNASAQNAMLKLLEEGPAYAAFLLITDNAAALLPTVRSRCETLALSPLPLPQIEPWLHTHYPDKSSAQLHAAAQSCEGLLGKAVLSLENGDTDSKIPDTARQLLLQLADRNERGLNELCISLEKWDRDSMEQLMGETVLLVRDALAIDAGCLHENDPVRKKSAMHIAESLTRGRLLSVVALLEKLRAACSYNIGTGHLAGWLCAGLCAQD